jgi:hypothetical protein
LRVPSVTRQRPEDLNPDFLRDVRRRIGIPAHQATHDHVDVRCVPGPEGPERPFIASNRSADEKRFLFHAHQIGHDPARKGLQGPDAGRRMPDAKMPDAGNNTRNAVPRLRSLMRRSIMS